MEQHFLLKKTAQKSTNIYMHVPSKIRNCDRSVKIVGVLDCAANRIGMRQNVYYYSSNKNYTT
jgi:hypothetical protein